MKNCTKCGLPKLLSEFHREAKASDGHKRICKACIAEYRKLPAVMAASREASRTWANSGHGRDYLRSWWSGNYGRYAEKHRARNGTKKGLASMAVRNAVRNRRIIKPKCCEDCGLETPKHLLHGHHEDYDNRLNVKWLCSSCHGHVHKQYA